MMDTSDLDDVEEAVEELDDVLKVGSVDDVRGVIVFVEADDKQTVIDLLDDEDAEMAVYTVGSDTDDVYRIGLPMEAV